VKARVHDVVKTSTGVPSEFAEGVIPRGTAGTIVECYDEPVGYAVDLALPDDRLVGGSRYANVVLTPEQFEVLVPALAARRRLLDKHGRRQSMARRHSSPRSASSPGATGFPTTPA
jgi:hypothetical protein